MPFEQQYESWERAFRTLAAENDEDMAGPSRMGNGPLEAACMKFSSRRFKGRASATCLLFQGTWSANFIGDEKDIDNFFHVVREAR